MINITRVTRVTRIAAAAAAAAAVAAVSVTVAPSASAAGFTTVQSCTNVSGKITYGKGLTSTAHTHHSVLTGSLSGCSGINGPQDGTGTISGTLVGKSSVTAVVETGTVTVNWPAGSGLNPSNASVMLRENGKNGPISVTGTITSGAFTGAPISLGLVPTTHVGSGSKAHPLKSQSLVNTTPLTVSRNFG